MKIKSSIDPYENCPCSSGKKYRFCCSTKKNKDFHNQNEFANYCMKYTKALSFCLFEDETCEGGIINSHSVQNNRILSKLAVDGHVQSLKRDINSLFGVNMDIISKNIVTTSRCFCNHHDTKIFLPIEKEALTKSNEKYLLFAYRAFSKAYYDRLQEIEGFHTLFDVRPEHFKIHKIIMDQWRGAELTKIDNERIKKIFNDAITNQDYDVIDTLVFKLDYEIHFATSFMTPIEYDLRNHVINNMAEMKEIRMKNLFINIFPEDGRSIILISWLKDDSNAFKNFKEQVLYLFMEKRDIFINMMNNLVVYYSDNFAINPTMIQQWGILKRSEFLKACGLFMTNRSDEISNNLICNKYSFNLFEK